MTEARRFLRDYSLSLVLAALWLIFWAIQTWTGWHEFVSESLVHHQAPHLWGPGGYVWTWAEASFENLQSEAFQLACFVVLSAYLLHRGSPQSRDGSERLEEKVDRILKRLEVREK